MFVNVIRYIKAHRGHEVRFRRCRYNLNSRIPDQVRRLYRLASFSDETCLRNLRMDRNPFGRLCYMLEHSGGVKPTKNVSMSEQVAMFLSVIAHHKKNCVVKHDFIRSCRTISKHFHAILHVVCQMHIVLLAKPTPIVDDCTDLRWKWFKDCLGALDGTFIDVRVPDHEMARYRTRKEHVAQNVLGVCNPNMQFIFVLSGWEGSATYSRVLRDVIHRPNGLYLPSEDPLEMELPDTRDAGDVSLVQGMRYKSWPFFPAWKEIFSMDRASGDRTWDPTRAGVEKTHHEPPKVQQCNAGMGDWNPKIGRKRKSYDPCPEIPQLVSMVFNFCETANNRIGSLTRVLEHEFGEPDKRGVVMAAVRELSGLEENDVIVVTMKLVHDPKDIDIFFSLTKELKEKMVRLILDGRI
ncbi:UNVERIFIED_CONTAM: hypothetical protein Slati_2901800 [Sesamum latifolium]|uniref:Transposase n=1 Tax=Sesamum latifolium TaxID=2727402 RepID=A0AAW2VCB3_9LAMI